MATMNKFPPDVPKNWDEATEEVEGAAEGLRAKAADVADRATETVKDGYYRAKDALTEMDPAEAVREGSDAVVRAVERNPLAAFGLGALSVGLIAWASLRRPEPSYQPDLGFVRRLFSDYGDDAVKAGKSALKDGESWFNSSSSQARDYAKDYASYARDYARDGTNFLAKRTEKEPIAALIGVGIAVYVLGSLLTSSTSEAAPQRRRTTKR